MKTFLRFFFTSSQKCEDESFGAHLDVYEVLVVLKHLILI